MQRVAPSPQHRHPHADRYQRTAAGTGHGDCLPAAARNVHAHGHALGQPWRKTRSRQGVAGSLPRQTWLAWVWCRAGGVRGAPGGQRKRDVDRDRGQRAAGHRQHCRDQRSLQRAKQRHRRGEQCSVGTRPDDAAELRACRTECSGCRKFARAVAPACRSGEHLPITACGSTCGRTPVGTMPTSTCFLASLGTERPSNIACNRINH